MTMSEDEIVREYKSAAKPKRQIGILAELNCCPPSKIKEILFNNGCTEIEISHKKRGRPPKKVEEKEPDMPYSEVGVEEEITEPVVNEEPPKPEIPAEVFDTVKDRIDELERQIWSLSDDLSRLLEKERTLRVWIEGVKKHE